MIVKEHKTREGGLMLAICDSSLKGKKFSENDLQLDLSSDFYDGKEMSEEDIMKLMKMASVINLVGEESVNCGLKAKIIEKENIIKVEGIPHAQGIVVREE